MILYLGNKLSAHGLSPTSVELLAPRISKLGFEVISRSSIKNQAFRLADMLLSIIRYWNSKPVVLIDTYSTSAFWYAVACGRLCSLLGLNYIPILRGGDLPARLSKNPKIANKLFLKSFSNIAISNYMKQEFEIRNLPVRTIHNSIDISIYPFIQRSIIKPRLLWVRSFHTIYNPFMAIDVLEQISLKHPEATLCMVGPEKDHSLKECRELVRNKKLNVTFTGKLTKEQWINLSQLYDIFINTTNVDNTPVSVMEAMALGMPVISTDAGGVPHLIDDGVNGILVPTHNSGKMVGAIEELLLDQQTVLNMSKEARKTALQWDWEIVAKQWKEVFNDAGIES